LAHPSKDFPKILKRIEPPATAGFDHRIEYAGFQVIGSIVDIGMDLSREYAEAKRLSR
jgi:hypothetical protein